MASAKRPPARLEVYARKEGHFLKNWKQRYIVVESGVLSYFTDSSRASLKGEITLKDYTLADFSSENPNEVYLIPPDDESKDLRIHFDTDSKAMTWRLGLKNHITFLAE